MRDKEDKRPITARANPQYSECETKKTSDLSQLVPTLNIASARQRRQATYHSSCLPSMGPGKYSLRQWTDDLTTQTPQQNSSTASRRKYSHKRRHNISQTNTILNLIIIYHDFLPTPRRGSQVKSGKTHTQSSRYTP